MVTLETISTAATKDLVAFYNANSANPVKKFADRATAEKRVAALIASLDAIEEAAPEAPVPEPTYKARALKAKPEEVNLEELSEEEAEAEFKASLTPTRKSNALAIAKSWSDPNVSAARLTRNGVTVTVNGETKEFKSTRAAFAHYNLPDSKHIRFRGMLKKAEVLNFEWVGVTYKFAII